MSERDKSVSIPISGLKINQLGILGMKIIIENPKLPNQIRDVYLSITLFALTSNLNIQIRTLSELNKTVSTPIAGWKTTNLEFEAWK